MNFEDVRSDYLRMLEIISCESDGEHIYNWCGGFCNCEKFDNLLLNPSKKVAKQMLIEAIKYTACFGVTGGYGDCSQYFYNVELLGIFDKYVDVISERWQA